MRTTSSAFTSIVSRCGGKVPLRISTTCWPGGSRNSFVGGEMPRFFPST
jgi:hypothetical protein